MEDAEKKLWQRYRRTKRQPARDELRNELVERYLPLAAAIARRKARTLPDSIEFDDLYSAAYQALIASVPRFDPARGVSPITFFGYRISGALVDWLRSIDATSRLTREREKRVNAWQQTELGHYATEEEIYEQFGFRLHRPATISLSEPRAVHAGQLQDLGELLVDRRQAAPDAGLSELAEILRGCSLRERLLLLLYHVDGQTMGEIGDSLGISESRVSQMMSNLKRRLRGAAA